MPPVPRLLEEAGVVSKQNSRYLLLAFLGDSASAKREVKQSLLLDHLRISLNVNEETLR
jgi:hypothetical protein